jgi:hypothetical protein
MIVSFQVSAQEFEPPVKKSRSGICHSKGSRFYNQTKNFTPFNTLDDCIRSGGREVGGRGNATERTNPQPESSEGPNVKKSKSGICHEKGTRFYNQTRNFTPFRSIDECVRSGGRKVGARGSARGAMTSRSQSSGEPNVKKSRSGICHLRGSSSYSRTKNFTPFTSLEKCVQSGGRPSKRG